MSSTAPPTARDSAPWLPGVHSAPNIQSAPTIYELENRALDRGRLITDAMWQIRPWDHAVVCDLGAGTAFWVQEFQAAARHVFAVEPHGPSRLLASERVAKHRWENVSVMAGSAAKTHLASNSVDLVHARFAYFWGVGCEPGIKEVERILAPGGAFVIIDNDLRLGTFAQWLQLLPPRYVRSGDVVDAFWREQGFELQTVRSSWTFDSRGDLEAVVRLELPSIADQVLAAHEGLVVDYGFRIISKTY